MSFDRKEYNRDYHAKQYDRFTITFKKGAREKIEQAAAAQSKSVNEFIVDCVLSAINQDQRTPTATAKGIDLDNMASFLSGGSVNFKYTPTKPREYKPFTSGDCQDDDDETLPF